MGAYKRLGIKSRINSAAYGTGMGGSIMFPEVVSAMQEASKSFISIPELLQNECNADEIYRSVIYLLKNPDLIKKDFI